MSDNNLRSNSNRESGCTAGKLQSFRFDLFCDGILYSTFFEGTVSQEETGRILEEMHRHLYKESPEVIREYLECHHVKYSRLHSREEILGHDKIMNIADILLHGSFTNMTANHIMNADNYYAAADHRKMVSRNVCEGCYFAVKKTSYAQNGMYTYRIAGQTFSDNRQDCSPYGYFAIRAAENSRLLRTLDEVSGGPVIPAFGCVDIIRLLMNIDTITNSRQVENLLYRMPGNDIK